MLFLLCSLIISVSYAQTTSTWENWQWLLGEWQGEGSGQPGQGGGSFSFTQELDDHVIIRKSHSEYPGRDNGPIVIHEDLMVVYKNPTGDPSTAIYFDNEGHTIRYQLKYTDKTIVFTSEKLENTPIFRLSYTLLDSGMVHTKFEMSRDGENFINYIEGTSKKIK